MIVALIFSDIGGAAQQTPQPRARTLIDFVRHGEANEADTSDPTHPLTPEGKVRARVFAATVHDVRFTHIFATHTTRARQMVEPTAVDHALTVKQIPAPGATFGGSFVSDATPSRVAVAPLVEALNQLPEGSTALVGVNADNLYAILNGLGVPVAASGSRCEIGSTCVPCLTNKCFPVSEFDHLWVLIRDLNASAPQLVSLRYGNVPPLPAQ
jgi:hypothetical protein